MKKVLVIAAHPDDEILGCGGTIARHVATGDTVHVIIAAEGLNSRFTDGEKAQTSEFNQLYSAAQKANSIVGVSNLDLLHFPDNKMDTIPLLEIVKPIEEKVSTWKPEIVYTHSSSDLNIDHRILQQAVLTACRPQPNTSVKSIRFFEVMSATHWYSSGSHSTEFLPNTFVDISAHLVKKMKALEAYHIEMRSWPHARSIEAVKYQALFRGACVGLEAAEAFVIGRELVS